MSKRRNRAKSGKDDMNCAPERQGKKAKIDVDITDSDSECESLNPSLSPPNK